MVPWEGMENFPGLQHGIRPSKRSLANCQPYKSMYMKGPKDVNAGDVAYR